MASSDNGQGRGPIKGPPPAIIAYLNPFLAQVDVLCGTETSSSGWCGAEMTLLQNTSATSSGINTVGGPVGGPVPPNVIIDSSGNKVLVPVPAVIGPDVTIGAGCCIAARVMLEQNVLNRD